MVFHLAAAFRKINLPKREYWQVNCPGDALRGGGVPPPPGAAPRVLLDAGRPRPRRAAARARGARRSPPRTTTSRRSTRASCALWEVARDGLEAIGAPPDGDLRPRRPGPVPHALSARSSRGRFLMFGDGETFYHPCYIDNLVDAFELAAEHPKAVGETYLIGDDRYVSLNELVTEVGRSLGQPARIVRLPFAPLWVASALCEAVLHAAWGSSRRSSGGAPTGSARLARSPSTRRCRELGLRGRACRSPRAFAARRPGTASTGTFARRCAASPGCSSFARGRRCPAHILEAMGKVIEHRGPDQGAIFQDGSVGLVARRLRDHRPLARRLAADPERGRHDPARLQRRDVQPRGASEGARGRSDTGSGAAATPRSSSTLTAMSVATKIRSCRLGAWPQTFPPVQQSVKPGGAPIPHALGGCL